MLTLKLKVADLTPCRALTRPLKQEMIMEDEQTAQLLCVTKRRNHEKSDEPLSYIQVGLRS